MLPCPCNIVHKQVGAKMGKSTRPVYWGRAVITGRTVVGDMLQWAPRMCSATSRWGWGGGNGRRGVGVAPGPGISPTIQLYVERFYKVKFN